jgi:SAM-dependent methyltransferase
MRGVSRHAAREFDPRANAVRLGNLVYEYDANFLSYGRSMATRSANVVVPIVMEALQPTSVLDLGCGRGAWLGVWKAAGATEVLGVDGEYVDLDDLAVETSEFSAQDLGGTIDLGRRFDLAESLEVAEHLPESRARGFVADLCRHSDIVLFGAAPPGQGGEHHINEQPYSFWRAFFLELGYETFDFVRPLIAQREEVAPWYRYNTMLYVKGSATDSLPETIRRAHVPDGTPIRDVSPVVYKLRKAIIRQLPDWATHTLANMAKKTTD